MQPLNFEQSVKKIIASDPRFHSEAYYFVREAIAYTRRGGSRPKSHARELAEGFSTGHHAGSSHPKGHGRDVGTAELLDGLRRYALETYGPMVVTVLAEWGVHRCEDIGEIVFHMIAHHWEGKSEADHRDDFKRGYTFEDAFRKPFLPAAHRGTAPKPVKA